MRNSRYSRRAIGALALVSTVSLAAVGCGTASNEASPEGYAPPDKDLSATITYGLWDQNQVPAIEESIAAFNEIYPDIKVNVSVTPFSEYWTKLQTQASSDTLPDLFWMNGPNIQLYALNGKLEPITGAIDAGDIDPTKYPESLVDLYTVEDESYGVPKDFDTIGVWINKELFERAGVAVPSEDWTWEDFQSTAADISTALADEGIYGGAGGMDGQTTYYNTIFQAGGEVIDGDASGYNSAQTQAGVQFWTDLIASGGSPTIPQLTDTSADQWYTSGKLAMYWGGSWFRSALADVPFVDSVDVLPLPQAEEQSTVIHGVSNVVASASKNKQAAQALQVYLASEEAQRAQGEFGSIIPAYEGTQDSFGESMPNVNLQVFLDAAAYSRPLPVSANSAAWNAFEAELLPQAFSGERPVAEVTEELAAKMDEALAKESR